jgi:crossover junction endodeoxyribonuclease RusA
VTPNFEFVIEGPPVPLRSKDKNPRRYRQWMKALREEAMLLWLPERKPLTIPVTMRITNCYTIDPPPDIDNIIKPIFDSLNGLVYDDDVRVHLVTSRKIELNKIRLTETTPLLAAALEKYTEVIHIEIFWEETT